MSDYNFKEEKIKSPIDGSNNCFKVFTEPATDEHYLCMSTGYMASSHFKLGDDKFQREMNNSPELVKALQHYDDETGLIWIPTVLNMGKLGMIFPEGNLESWSWCYAKNIEIPEDEQKNYPIPGKDGEFFSSRLDIENAQRYENNQFMEACKAMGVIKDGRLDTSGVTDGE